MAKKISNEILCSAMLTHGTIKEVASFLNVSEKTIFNMMHDYDFKVMYQHAQADIYNNTVVACQNIMIDAINCIANIMNDENNPASVRLQASQTILKYSVVMYDVKERIKNTSIDYFSL